MLDSLKKLKRVKLLDRFLYVLVQYLSFAVDKHEIDSPYGHHC